MVSNRRLVVALSGAVTLLGGCSNSNGEQAEVAAVQPSSTLNAAPPSHSGFDIHQTTLPDSNYANADQLQTRKSGFAVQSAANADPSKRGSIDPSAIAPYTSSEAPDAIRRWGSLIPTINRERIEAAELATREPLCDGVTQAQITDHSTPADRHYMIECNNITRIYFDAASLKASRPAVVRTEADMGAQGVLDW